MEEQQQGSANEGSPSRTLSLSTSGSGSGIARDDKKAEQRPKKARRTFLTQNACTNCRKKKSKCDGKRPTCARCERYGTECVYDVEWEGLTRMQNLQRQLDGRTIEHDKLVRLFKLMQGGSDHEATNILARLRLGESVDQLIAPSGSQSSSSAPLRDYMQSQLQQQQQQHLQQQQQQQQQQRRPQPQPHQHSFPPFAQNWTPSPMQDQVHWPNADHFSEFRSVSHSSGERPSFATTPWSDNSMDLRSPALPSPSGSHFRDSQQPGQMQLTNPGQDQRPRNQPEPPQDHRS